jgi:hypothetical protein
MKPAAKVLIGIAMFFMAPVCVSAGVLGGCLLGAVSNPTGETGATAGSIAGCLVGLGAAIFIPVLVMRNIATKTRPS